MTSLLIRRPKVMWQDRLRSYRILIDQTEVAQIDNGAEVEISVSAGRHNVQLKVDWGKSKTLDIEIASGETLILECGPNSKPWLALLYITIFKNNYLWLRHASMPSTL